MNVQQTQVKPYAVRRAYKTNAYGMGGWHCNVIDYSTLEEAEKAYSSPMTGREFHVELVQREGKKLVTVKSRRRAKKKT